MPSAPALNSPQGRGGCCLRLRSGPRGFERTLGSPGPPPAPQGSPLPHKGISPEGTCPPPQKSLGPWGVSVEGHKGRGWGAARPRWGAHPVPPPVLGSLGAPGQGLCWDLSQQVLIDALVGKGMWVLVVNQDSRESSRPPALDGIPSPL